MITEFSAEFRFECGSVELPDLVQKIMEKQTFHGIGGIFQFLIVECPFFCKEFPFLERRISNFLSAELWAIF